MARKPTTNAARRTTDRVLDAALELFNERGSAAVTTNHIAAHAGISPGNLYYWFGDKDEIVRELYARLAAAHQEMWDAADGEPAGLTPADLLSRLADGAELSRQYVFFARDLLGVLHADPVLAAEYTAVRARRIAELNAMARAWRSAGLIRSLEDRDLADLVQALWILAETWLAFGELDGSYVDPADGTRLLRAVLAPYLSVDAATTINPLTRYKP